MAQSRQEQLLQVAFDTLIGNFFTETNYAELAKLLSELTQHEVREDIAAYILQQMQLVADNDPAARGESLASTVFYTNPGLKILHALSNRLWPVNKHVAKSVWALNKHLNGADIHPLAMLDRSVFVDHGIGLVIGATAILEEGVQVLQNSTVGGQAGKEVTEARDGQRVLRIGSEGFYDTGTVVKRRHPHIEKNCELGACGGLVGPIRIAQDVIVGYGATVTKNVPPGLVIVNTNEVHALKNPLTQEQTILTKPDSNRRYRLGDPCVNDFAAKQYSLYIDREMQVLKTAHNDPRLVYYREQLAMHSALHQKFCEDSQAENSHAIAYVHLEQIRSGMTM